MKKTMAKGALLALGMLGLTSCVGIGILPGRPLRIQGEPIMTEAHLNGVSHWAQGPHPDIHI